MTAWKLTLPCTKAEAEAVAAAEIDGAALVATEEDEAAGRWRLDAYFEGEPDAETLAAVRALVADADDAAPAPLASQDWVTLSQAGLEPVRAGRFVVHTAAHPADPPPGGRAFRIEAGQAFGTGHHETTAGCLLALDGFARERAQFGDIIDLGSGTGLLAFAALELWPDARVLATDIDPVAVEVLRENAAANRIPLGDGGGTVSLLVADGVHHPAIVARAPFDLIIANILAGPLIDMALEIVNIARPGATILLAGLLTSQAEAVTDAYRAAGCLPSRSARQGDWTILELFVAPETVPVPGTRSYVPPMRSAARRAGQVAAALAVAVVLYIVAGLIGGLLPTNGAWRAPAQGVTVYVESNGIHTDLVMPKLAEGVDWRDLARAQDLRDPRYARFNHVAIGWGDKAFFLQTQHWSDMRPGTVLAAASGSEATLLHIEHLPPPAPGPDVRRLVLRPEEYRRLAAFIRASVAPGGRHYPGYDRNDAFLDARGRYSAMRTCNSWTGEALRAAGVRVGRWTPFPWTVLRWF